MRKTINTTAAPAAIGPYSQGVRAGDFVFTAGQLGLDPITGKLPDGVQAQAEQALKNLETILAEAGATFEDVVKTTIFLADMADFQTVNMVYAARFAADPPARTTVQAAGLPRRALVEIDMVAWAPER
jgi:2-iminobutanoate/2-iminopropanoate deaminase